MRGLRNFLRLALTEYSLSERVGLSPPLAGNEMSAPFLIYF